MFDVSHSPFSPIPGTQRAPHGLFIDRWGTLLCPEPGDPPLGFAPELLTPRAVETLFRAQQAGWLLYLIGNEEAVAFGRQSEQSWRNFEADLLAHLASLGVSVQRSYACLDHPDGRGQHAMPSVFQLPNTGVFYHAQQYDGVRLEDCWVIGDSSLELAAGDRVGCRLAALGEQRGLADDELFVDPLFYSPSLVAALEQVLEADACSRI